MRYLLLAALLFAAAYSWGGHDDGHLARPNVPAQTLDVDRPSDLPREEEVDGDVTRLLRRWPVDRRVLIVAGDGVVVEQEELGDTVKRFRGDASSLADLAATVQEEAVGEWFYLSVYCCKNDPGGAYCGTTAAQVQVAEGMVACSRHFPFGTRFKIRGDTLHGQGVVCRDRGSAVTASNHLDVYFEDCGDQQDPAPDTGWAWLQKVGTEALVEVLDE